ncbi:MAG TPA: hypothetical protein VMU12_00905 [Candidatus Paceibacterota bacterium]|nr:hypothetical protein [Candidatus Paceibacterota bacterium]
MLRDLTLIFSVLLAIVSVAFGAYKNIEAGNAQGFAYEQTYRTLNAVQQANISTAAKASITGTVLGGLATPRPVIDLSRSNAGVLTPGACSAAKQATCDALAATLGAANATCVKTNRPVDCTAAQQARIDVLSSSCIACFNP